MQKSKFSKRPKNLRGAVLENKKNIYAKFHLRGWASGPQALAPPPPGGGGQACGQPTGPLAPLFCYMKRPGPEKINRELFRGFAAATRRNLSRTNLELRQDDPAGETSLPEGEIVAIVITNTPLVGGEASSSTSSSAPSPLQSLVHLL